jgi:1-acyl-sn-glycerol-3-phosphate acyltransferase
MYPLFTAFYWFFVGLTAIFLYAVAVIIWLVTMPFDRNRTILHRYTCWWAVLYLRFLPGCRIRVENREKMQPGVGYVLVANHQSMADIMALSALAVPFKWVSKKEAFRLPFIGWNMYLNNYVCVDRGNVRSVRGTMDACRSWLERGVPVMMFPEGHRSPDGEIHDFHGGAFKLAVDSAAPVLPIVVNGTRPIYTGMKVHPFPGVITIRILDPIPVANTSALKLRDQVYELMKRELSEIRGEPLAAKTA